MPRFIRLNHHAVSQMALPAAVLLFLVITWVITFRLMDRNERQADTEAVQQTKRLMDAYEAHVLRVLGEVNQTFKLIDYAYAETGVDGTLERLQRRHLLLPNIVFTTRVIDSQGRVIGSSKASGLQRPVAAGLLKQHAASDEVFVSTPHPGAPGGGEPLIEISRRIGDPGEGHWYIVEVTMPANYLVSDYDEARLGRRGVLAVLGSDGVFRVKRIGNDTRSGEHTAYDTVVTALQSVPENTSTMRTPWDKEERYLAARPVYGYPLALIVGLSRPERQASQAAGTQALLVQVGMASAAAVIITGLLMGFGRRLATLREQEQAAQRAYAARIEHMAFHDALTALPNRALFSRTLRAHLERRRRDATHSALLFLDLDGFKRVNDVQGHQAGDELLRQVARRLQGQVRSDDFIARLGGDEFVVLLRRITDADEAMHLAARLVKAVAQPYELLGREARVTTSIGVCLCPDDGEDEDTVTRHADQAMYEAKQQGKNTVRLFGQATATA